MSIDAVANAIPGVSKKQTDAISLASFLILSQPGYFYSSAGSFTAPVDRPIADLPRPDTGANHRPPSLNCRAVFRLQ
jgi:hypothetical protein